MDTSISGDLVYFKITYDKKGITRGGGLGYLASPIPFRIFKKNPATNREIE